MAEAQALADRVVLLNNGAVVAEGPPAGLGGRDTETVRITFMLPPGFPAAALPVPADMHNGAVVIETASPTEELHRLTSWAIRRDIALSGLTVDRPSLEDVYLRLTRDGAPFGAPERSPR
jgi:ABC-2 type transport system ATP-binding protein